MEWGKLSSSTGTLVNKNRGEIKGKITQTFFVSIIISIFVFLRVIPLASEFLLL